MSDEPKVVSASGSAGGHATVMAVGRSFLSPPGIDHPIYPLIGRVTVTWSLLEHHLDQIIWRLTGLPSHAAACLTAQMMGTGPRYDTILAFLEYYRLSDRLKKDIKSHQGALTDLGEARNRIIHDVWSVDAQTGKPHQFKSMPRRQKIFGIYEYPAHELELLLQKINKRMGELSELGQRIVSERVP